MQAPPDPSAPDPQYSGLRQQLESQTSALDVLTQLAEQVVALGDEGQAHGWRERLLTTLQGKMTETHSEIQATQAALAQLADLEGQS